MRGHRTVRGVIAVGPTTPASSQALEVTATHVSLMAHETPLVDVLKAIGQQAGVKSCRVASSTHRSQQCSPMCISTRPPAAEPLAERLFSVYGGRTKPMTTLQQIHLRCAGCNRRIGDFVNDIF